MRMTASSPDLSLFLPDFARMTRPELLDYLARTRRQLDRLQELPTGIDAAEATAIRDLCNELEASLTVATPDQN